MMLVRHIVATGAAVVTGLAATTSFAAEPLPWQTHFQPAATPVMERLTDFHSLLLVIITSIVVFVLALLVYTAMRFSAKNNPEPSKTTHNTPMSCPRPILPSR
jgi:cytochrome c oxidase subunit 2